MTRRTETENDGIPAPTCARIELPDEAAVQRLALKMGLDEARTVLTVLSAVIAAGRSKTREKIAQMNCATVACCRVESMRDGVLMSAAHPELAEFGWPAGATALRRRHRPRPLHLPRARAAHGRPDLGRVGRARQRLDLHVELPAACGPQS